MSIEDINEIGRMVTMAFAVFVLFLVAMAGLFKEPSA